MIVGGVSANAADTFIREVTFEVLERADSIYDFQLVRRHVKVTIC